MVKRKGAAGMTDKELDILLILKCALDAGATVRKADDKHKSGIYLHGERITEDKLYECLFDPSFTNGDKIRAMNDEALAHFIGKGFPPEACPNNCDTDPDRLCEVCVLEWLQKEAPQDPAEQEC